RTRRSGGAKLRSALEAGGTVRSHRAAAERHGLQRHAQRPLDFLPGGRAMSLDAVEPNNLIADAIDAAEEIRDPLDGLVEKTTTDPGAPFMPDALEALCALKNDNLGTFETLRSRLKDAGCRVTILDGAI